MAVTDRATIKLVGEGTRRGRGRGESGFGLRRDASGVRRTSSRFEVFSAGRMSKILVYVVLHGEIDEGWKGSDDERTKSGSSAGLVPVNLRGPLAILALIESAIDSLLIHCCKSRRTPVWN